MQGELAHEAGSHRARATSTPPSAPCAPTSTARSSWRKAAAADGATLVAFPEQLVGGYPPEDLVQWRSFVDAQWPELAALRRTRRAALRRRCSSSASPSRAAPASTTARRWCTRGRVLGLVPKEKLPTYNVFYEGRTFARGAPGLVRRGRTACPSATSSSTLDFGTLALEVCEDIWSPDGPMRRRCYAGAELVVNVSASPFRLGVVDTRREMIATRAGDNQCVVAYANLVGANDGLVFDGGGYVAQNGRAGASAPRFGEGVARGDGRSRSHARACARENTTWRTDQESFAAHRARDRSCRRDGANRRPRAGCAIRRPRTRASSCRRPTQPRSARAPSSARICSTRWRSGVGDYFEKIGAFKTIGVALSGGRDSLLCLLIARRYVAAALRAGAQAARRRDAARLLHADALLVGGDARAPPRRPRATGRAAARSSPSTTPSSASCRRSSKMLQPGETLTPMARQNVQARLRAERMWTWANCAAGLFLQTAT